MPEQFRIPKKRATPRRGAGFGMEAASFRGRWVTSDVLSFVAYSGDKGILHLGRANKHVSQNKVGCAVSLKAGSGSSI